MSFKRINKDTVFNSLGVTNPFQPNGGLIQPSSIEFTTINSITSTTLDFSSSGRTVGIRLTGNSEFNVIFPTNLPDGYTIKFVVIETGGNGQMKFRQLPVKSIVSLTRNGSTQNFNGNDEFLFPPPNSNPGDYIQYTKLGDCYVINGVSQTSFGIDNI